MSKYPEATKLAEIADVSQAQGEFVEWLNERGYWLCETTETGEFVPAHTPITSLLARYHNIDMDALEREKRAMLKEVRSSGK